MKIGVSGPEFPAGVGEAGEISAGGCVEVVDQRGEANADAPEQGDGVWAIDRMGDAEGFDQSRERWVIWMQVGMFEHAAELWPESCTQGRKAHVCLERAAASIGPDGDVCVEFWEGDVELSEVSWATSGNDEGAMIRAVEDGSADAGAHADGEEAALDGVGDGEVERCGVGVGLRDNREAVRECFLPGE